MVAMSPDIARDTYILASKSDAVAVRALAMTQLWDLARVDQDLAMNLAIAGSSDSDESVRAHAFRAWMSLVALTESKN